MRRVEKLFKIGFDEVDASGWFYGAVYFKYVNELLFSLLKEIGYPMTRLLRDGLATPPVKYVIDFHKPAKYGDVIVGEMQITKLGNSSIHLSFRFKNKDTRDTYAEGFTVRVFVDMKKEKSIPIPPDIREKLLSLG